MSICVAYVGDVIIKPEFRKDLGHLFRREYDLIESEPLKEFAEDVMDYSSFRQLFKMSEWKHFDLLRAWEG